MVTTNPRAPKLNGALHAGPHLERAVRDYVRAYASLHGRRMAAKDLGVSRHTLWRFLERGHMGRAVPDAVLNSVGGNTAALEAATLEIIIDLRVGGRTLHCVPCARVSRKRSYRCVPHPWPRWTSCRGWAAFLLPRSETG